MIEKMKFLSITGPKADIDRMTETYLSKYEIHLENALSELTTVESLTPFIEVNPYRDALNSINTIYEELKSPPAASPGSRRSLFTFDGIGISTFTPCFPIGRTTESFSQKSFPLS